MLSIKNNMMAANAARHLGINYNALAQSVERLSSGLRINSAKDDAAGMAVAEGIRADVATFQQGSRNAQDAISMLQTAEGALGVIDDNLVRMKELAEQASTDSYSADQKDIMNAEFQQLADEIDRIAKSTTFNGISLLNSTATRTIDVGAGTISIDSATLTGDGLGLTATKTIEANKNAVTDPNDAVNAFATTADGDQFVFQFGTEAAVTVQWDAVDGNTGARTMTETAADINADAGYSAASVVFDAKTGIYTLKLSAKNGGNGTVNITASDPAELAANQWLETVGSANNLSIGSTGNTTLAMQGVADAITQKDQYRAQLGYMMNRLQSAVRVVDIQAENLQTAQSRISDVDVATEMAAMTRTNVLAQAGISMLAQANNMPQMALQLLRG